MKKIQIKSKRNKFLIILATATTIILLLSVFINHCEVAMHFIEYPVDTVANQEYRKTHKYKEYYKICDLYNTPKMNILAFICNYNYKIFTAPCRYLVTNWYCHCDHCMECNPDFDHWFPADEK